MFFFFVLWSPTSALLTPMAGVKSRLALYNFFFLSFLALLEDSESWVGVGMETLALDLFPQWSFIAPWVWTLYAVVWAG